MTDQGNIKILSFVTIRDPDIEAIYITQNDLPNSFIGGISPLSADENEAARARFTASLLAMEWNI